MSERIIRALIYDISFSADDPEMVSASGDRTVRVWRVQSVSETEEGTSDVSRGHLLSVLHPCFVCATRIHPTAADPQFVSVIHSFSAADHNVSFAPIRWVDSIDS